jgi:hypothetical protein
VGSGISFVSQLYLVTFMSWGGKEEGEAMYAREGLLYVNIIKLEVRRLIRCVESPTVSRSREKVGDKRQRPLLHTPIRPRAYLVAGHAHHDKNNSIGTLHGFYY